MLCTYVTVYQISLNIMNTNNKDAIKCRCKHTNFGLNFWPVTSNTSNIYLWFNVHTVLQTIKYQSYKLSQNINLSNTALV